MSLVAERYIRASPLLWGALIGASLAWLPPVVARAANQGWLGVASWELRPGLARGDCGRVRQPRWRLSSGSGPFPAVEPGLRDLAPLRLGAVRLGPSGTRGQALGWLRHQGLLRLRRSTAAHLCGALPLDPGGARGHLLASWNDGDGWNFAVAGVP